VSELLKGKPMFGKQFSPISDEDFRALINSIELVPGNLKNMLMILRLGKSQIEWRMS